MRDTHDMGLAEDLGYSHRSPNAVRRGVLSVAATRGGSWLLKHTQHRLDRLVVRMSSGRATVTSWLSGFEPLWLTTQGARSGEPRSVPVFGFPIPPHLGVLGTSYGQRGTPGWVHNLLAYPAAQVSFGAKSMTVVARLAEPDENRLIWETANLAYSGFANYRRWAGHREIRVFVLESV